MNYGLIHFFIIWNFHLKIQQNKNRKEQVKLILHVNLKKNEGGKEYYFVVIRLLILLQFILYCWLVYIVLVESK